MEALSPHWRPLFAISVYLGLRRGEALGLLKRDVDLARREITVGRSWERDRTKGDHTEVLPIPDALVPWLKQAKEVSPSALVFPGPKGGMVSKSVRLPGVLLRALARAGITTGFEHRCRRHGCGHKEAASDGGLRRCPVDGRKLWPVAQVRPVRWHDLRHSTASCLKVAGVHLVDAQKILRHADPRTTEAIYTHVDIDQLRPAVNRMPFDLSRFEQRVDEDVDEGLDDVIPAVQTLGITARDTGLEPVAFGSGGARAVHPLASPTWQTFSRTGSEGTTGSSKGRTGRLRTAPRVPPVSPSLSAFPALQVVERPEILRVSDVAAALQVSTATVYGLCERGKLAYLRVSGAIRVLREDLEAFIRGRG
jgi:excisionase family DNA binding protein